MSGSAGRNRGWKTSETSDLSSLEGLGEWGGPLIVSMPRTGSTLLGTLMLLAGGEGNPALQRYVHEPAAPIYWEGASVESIGDLVGGSLNAGDVVQESAYQFTAPDVARWFVRKARDPVAFTVRDPQIAWPSRWRIMLRERVERDPEHPDAARMHQAVEESDYSQVGDILRDRVVQPDNGWLAFTDVIEMCRREGKAVSIVENARFRADPEAVLGSLCRGWGVAFSRAMVEWDTLDPVLGRVVMSRLAAETEYEGYYSGTLGSRGGIRRTDSEPLPLDRFPAELRSGGSAPVSIDEAVAWYRELLEAPEVL